MAGHALIVTLLWLALACGLSLTRARGRRWLLVGLIVTGIPVLGLVTRDFGALCGIVALMSGMGLLKVIHHGHRRPDGGFSLARPPRPH